MPATAPTAVALSRDQFLAGVRAAGVLGERQFARLEASLTPFQKTAREAADHLVTGGFLTRFQADRLLTGRTDGFLLGQYVVLDYCGKTDTSRVYTARHRTMNRTVTVQVLKAELTATEEVRDGIRGRARAAAKLAHPNLVTLLDVNALGDRMYLVQEYLDGPDLGAMVKATGPLPVARACEFVRQAALGVQHAHEKGTVHGRLTPAAVRVGRPGGSGPPGKPVVKVDGLGLWQIADDGTDTGYEYHAPEQFADPHRADPACDLYALGCVFHLLLTGLPPFPAADAAQAGHRHTTARLQPLRYQRPDLPAGVAKLLEQLLAKDPTDRPASAEAVAVALDGYCSTLDSAGQIDFSAMPPSAGPVSGGADLTGLLRADTAPHHCPWAELTSPAGPVLATDPFAPGASDHTPLAVRRPPRRRRAGDAVILGATIGGGLGLLGALAVLLRLLLG